MNLPLYIYRILPPPLRSLFMRVWLEVLLWPLDAVQAAFGATRTRLLRQVSYNGQTVVLERCLNLEFTGSWSAMTPNALWIENLNTPIGVAYLYYASEEEAVDVYVYGLGEANTPPLYLYDAGDPLGQYNFVVHYPLGMTEAQLSRLRYLVNLYRIAPMRYSLRGYVPPVPVAPAEAFSLGCGTLTLADPSPAGFVTQWSRTADFATIAATGSSYTALYNTVGRNPVYLRYLYPWGSPSTAVETAAWVGMPGAPDAPEPQTRVGCGDITFNKASDTPLAGFELQWSLDNFATIAYTGEIYTLSYTGIPVGGLVQSVYVRYVDACGNATATASTTATVSLPAVTAPTAQSRQGCGALTFSVDTPPAGFTAQWSLQANFGTIAATGTSYTGTFSTVGATPVYVRYVDSCGNATATASTTATVTLPAAPVGSITPDVLPNNVPVTLAFGGSIPAGFTLEWSQDNFATVAATGSAFPSTFLLASSPYTLSLRFKDACGNAGAVTQAVREVFSFGNALAVDGTNDVWQASHNAFTDIDTGDFAINFWARRNNLDANHPLIHKYHATAGALKGWQFVTHVSGARGQVRAIALYNDNIMIGGSYLFYNEGSQQRLSLLNGDGALNYSFSGQVNSGIVLEAIVQPDGRVLIAGTFIQVNGVAAGRIARLNANGSTDAIFNTGTGANGTIEHAAIQSDGKVLIGGSFSQFNGAAAGRIARLNANGSLDTTFNTGTGANGLVLHIAPQSDGKILIGGTFTQFNGAPAVSIARLNANGSLDTTFNTGTGANGSVWHVAPQSDGKILIGGSFTQVGGVTVGRIARLNANGSLDTTFNAGTGANSTIFHIAPQSDGKILIGGTFTQFNGVAAGSIARLNANGSLDTTFNTGTGTSGIVFHITPQADGKILVGGSFTTFNEGAVNNIIRLNANGSLDTSFNSTGGASFVYAQNGTTPVAVPVGGEVLAQNVWHMLTITRTSGVLSLYVNGVKRRADVPVPTSLTNTRPLLIGGNAFPTPVDVLNGRLDEYTHYNRGLTDAEVTTLYGGGNGMRPYGSLLTGLQVRYSFDALLTDVYPGPTIADLSGNGNTLTGFNISNNPLLAH